MSSGKKNPPRSQPFTAPSAASSITPFDVDDEASSREDVREASDLASQLLPSMPPIQRDESDPDTNTDGPDWIVKNEDEDFPRRTERVLSFSPSGAPKSDGIPLRELVRPLVFNGEIKRPVDVEIELKKLYRAADFSGVIVIKNLTNAWILVEIFAFFANNPISKAKPHDILIRCAGVKSLLEYAGHLRAVQLSVGQLCLFERGKNRVREHEDLDVLPTDIEKEDMIVSGLELLKERALAHGGRQTQGEYIKQVESFFKMAGDTENSKVIDGLLQELGGLNEVRKQLRGRNS